MRAALIRRSLRRRSFRSCSGAWTPCETPPAGADFLLVILIEAALINTHNLQAVLITGVAFAWLAWEGLIHRFNRESSRLDSRGDLWAALALLLGIVTAASFWLPILLEGHTITREGLFKVWTISLWPSLSELLKIPDQFYSWERPTFTASIHIGIAQWTYALFGAVGALALYVRGYRTRHPGAFLAALFFFLLSLALIFMMLPWSHPLWHSFVPFRYLQFPLRFLGPIVFCCGYLASLNGLWLRRLPGNAGLIAIALAVAAVVVAGFAMSRTMSWKRQNIDMSTLRLMTSSRPGASPTDDYLPSTASRDVDQTRLLEDYVDGNPIDKFDRESLPPGAEATLLGNAPESHAWRVFSPEPFERDYLKLLVARLGGDGRWQCCAGRACAQLGLDSRISAGRRLYAACLPGVDAATRRWRAAIGFGACQRHDAGLALAATGHLAAPLCRRASHDDQRDEGHPACVPHYRRLLFSYLFLARVPPANSRHWDRGKHARRRS